MLTAFVKMFLALIKYKNSRCLWQDLYRAL